MHDNKTVGRNVLGMHCLRNTFITHLVNELEKSGINSKQALGNVQPLVGHCGDSTDENGKDLSMTKGYVDRSLLESTQDNILELKRIIEFLNYGFDFPILS